MGSGTLQDTELGFPGNSVWFLTIAASEVSGVMLGPAGNAVVLWALCVNVSTGGSNAARECVSTSFLAGPSTHRARNPRHFRRCGT